MSKTTDYRGFRTAGARLTEEPLAHLDFHRSSLLGESVHAIHAFDKAHALMLSEEGIVPRATGVAMLKAFRQMEGEGVEKARAEADGGMHSGEHYLTKTLGEDIGGRLHLGRSSGDLIEVARRITFRSHVQRMLAALTGLRGTLLALAREHRQTVMPGYTHGQHAQPTTFAHWLTMFEEVFARDTQRLLSFYGRVNRSPAGAAIMTGSDFPLNRHRISDLLGFDAPLSHTMDAILSHDLEMDYAGVLAVLAQNIGRLADDLFLWSTIEFAMVELPDRYCGTSSIMPQKKNPDGLEDIKGVAAQSLGIVATVMMAEKGPTGFPIMERRNSQAILWDLGRGLGVRLETLGPLMRDLKVRVERMRALAGANWAQVTDLASALVRERAIDWRTSHQIVSVFVRQNIEAGITPDKATSTSLDKAAETLGIDAPGLPDAVFADAMDPAAFVRRRGIYGGPAPEAILREIGAAETRLEADAKAVSALGEQSDKAHEALEEAISAHLAG
ncbi:MULTISPECIES: argininosuccinate lyase [unclassified Chelatococcus]|uniref:argininosuccinate lyase n=1 Tax=unclassified Chelatococcus TaxID=2638111 RepID=UPI001BCEF828|nr:MULTISPECIES: argininosuccinate lyase [unclassified Chelatococcus]CAH1649825.1 Argininosuccinate lyase [Hyphomicrobiales bacterium]MBS7743391.1 argininosuccinate lyase [Chelatococcus sp. HY11]MBX3541491.1 argininosuccinate lyase [Chelatococcus sp.]MCO5074616.1 argininosuccinate lyase [Chelatococcus sp.]CAH1692219.1 Argininosuccinate lyase [Hyphomicrobiales bacterium]